MNKPRTRFCWHCARQLQGNHFVEYESENGKVIVHKACLEALNSGFDTTLAIDTPEHEEAYEEINGQTI